VVRHESSEDDDGRETEGGARELGTANGRGQGTGVLKASRPGVIGEATIRAILTHAEA
jgi:hypothetical protein